MFGIWDLGGDEVRYVVYWTATMSGMGWEWEWDGMGWE